MPESVSTDQLLHIIGMKEVEIILCKARIAELVVKLSEVEGQGEKIDKGV